MNTPLVPQEVLNIAEVLHTKGYSCYIAGGWCRDYFVWNSHSDIDLFTDALPEQMKQCLLVVWEVGKKYGTCLVQSGEKVFEITSFRKDIGTINNRKPAKVVFTKVLEEDAQRRDFTCNAIYYDILKETFIDPTDWISDIHKKIIRSIGKLEQRLEEDILRLLRYVRIKYSYGFVPAEQDYHTILSEYCPLIKNISPERIKQEIEKIFCIESNTQALQELKDIGFFKVCIPILETLDNTPGGAPWHLEGNVWIHTLMTIDEITQISLREEKIPLIWAMLMHDSGKSDTITFDENGRVHYYGHEQVSAKHFKQLALKWRFSKSDTELIHWLIDNHLKVWLSLKMHPVKRHTFMMHPYFPLLLKVYEADKKGRVPIILDGVESVKKYYKTFAQKIQQIQFFTGSDVLKKHPEIEWKKIGEILQQWNNQILWEITCD